jgi:hypothetical protein
MQSPKVNDDRLGRSGCTLIGGGCQRCAASCSVVKGLQHNDQ